MVATLSQDYFQESLTFTLKWEGGFVNDPDDPGGRTNLGITQGTLNEYRRRFGEGPADVKQLTSGQATRIYERLFWQPAGCPVMPRRLAIAHFDWAVNHGVGGAVKDLQRCFGNINADGGFGLQTEQQLKEYLSSYGENALLKAYLAERRRFYEQGNPKFRQGWLNRLNALEKYLATLPATATPPATVLQKPAIVTPPPAFDFVNVFKYWNNSPNQVKAAQYLWDNSQPAVKDQFIQIWRTPISPPPTVLSGPISDEKFNYTASQNTTIKLSPVDSSQLLAEQRAQIKAGTELTCIAHETAPGNHVKVTLDGATIRGQRVWYLYKPHWQLEQSQPEAHEEITLTKEPPPGDRGRAIQVPGLSAPVYLNDPVCSDSPHFFWYEATHGGERLPQNSNHTANIIKIACMAEEARTKLGQPLRITSWYRPEPFNSRAGGAKQSTHLQGLALDFNCGTMSGKQMARILSDWRGGMGIYRNFPMLLHLDARSSKARWGGA
jgi:lysozyme family protein